MADNFWTKLSKQEKIIFYVATAFVILAIMDRLVFNVIFSRMESIDGDIKSQELLIKKDLKLLSQKDLILKLDKQYSKYSVKAKSTEEEISAILKEIETLAAKSQIVLIEVKPTNSVDEKHIKKYSITLSCEGTMEQLASFISYIENSTELFAVDNYSLTSKDREKGILRCNMTISKIVIP